MKLTALDRSKLPGMEHYQYAGHVLRMCKEAGVEKLTAVLKPLEDALKREDEALNYPRSKEGSKELDTLDSVRDTAYRALMKALEAAELSIDADEAKAADKLKEVAKRYPGVVRANYDRETGLIENLVTDLKSAECTAAVTKLKLAAAITRLETANTAFGDCYHNRYKSGRAVDDLKELRVATDDAIDKVLLRVVALNELDPGEAITALIQHYNNYVHDRHTVIKQHKNSTAHENAVRVEQQRQMLLPMFDALAKTLGVAAEALHYSGESRGSGAKKCYRLTIDGRANDVWVKVVRKKKLVQVPESEVPKAKNGGKKNGGSGNGSSGNGSSGNGGNGDGSSNGGSGNGSQGSGSGSGSGSGNPGGNKPGGSGQGDATVTPKK
ncbi:hypothetical protein SAMN02745202_01940 [Segatella oulorum]|uniref:Uncharacterized protein n=1 Tax=Segatella oulorum TaxID=28136 RepID=A0A1T4QU67_9BACT|nr:DUF6261 family protein [Segatella oulorum]SKA07011.1 hypothetical protein SAMN02745202_01940 [Segatella oulorum]